MFQSKSRTKSKKSILVWAKEGKSMDAKSNDRMSFFIIWLFDGLNLFFWFICKLFSFVEQVIQGTGDGFADVVGFGASHAFSSASADDLMGLGGDELYGYFQSIAP